MSAKPLIHVVDDDESLRTALLELLDAAGYEAVGYASTGAFLLEPPPDRPGCVLLDVRLPGPSGLELQVALQRRAFRCRSSFSRVTRMCRQACER